MLENYLLVAKNLSNNTSSSAKKVQLKSAKTRKR